MPSREIFRLTEIVEVTGDVFTVDQWVELVKTGGLIDYDGFGQYAKKVREKYYVSRVERDLERIGDAIPSDITSMKHVSPNWATHVIWYNR